MGKRQIFSPSSIGKFLFAGILIVFTIFFGAGTAFATITLTTASGGGAISADTNIANGTATWTTLNGPIFNEGANHDVGTGTIILNAPSGFSFSTSSAVTVLVTCTNSCTFGAARNINGIASGSTIATTQTSSTIFITITSTDQGSTKNSLTWQNIQVRPKTGTLPVSGNILSSGTASVSGVTNGTTNIGTLTEVVGAKFKLAFTTQPSATSTAGVGFVIKPVVTLQDKFGNTETGDSASTITRTAVLSNQICGGTAGSGTLSSTPANGTAVTAGVMTYTAMQYSAAESIKICATSASVTSTLSNAIVVMGTTAITVTSTANPSTYGNSITFTATVTPSSGGPPTGTVTFKDGAATLGTGTLNGATPGVATFATTTLNVTGSPHSITAVYAGDSNFSGSTSGAISQAITAKALTVTGIMASNKAYDGTTVATISTSSAALVGVIAGDTVTLNTGSAIGTFATSTVGTGITVTISGFTISGAQSGNYTLTQPTTTANITQATQATLTATSTPGTVQYGSTATLSFSGGSGTGSVSFSVGASTSCSVAGGTTLNVTDASGTCSVTATKAADTNYNSATSATVSVTLTPRSITVTANAATKIYGDADPTFTYTSTVSTTFTGALSRVAGETVGTYAITIGSLSAGGNYTITFVSANLTINNPVPVLTSISPTSTIAGGSGFTLTLSGTNFVSGSVVNWNGTARTTTYVTSAQLTAAILASDITSAGSASVTVTNSAPGGGTSVAQTFTIESGAATQFALSHPGTMGAGTRASYTVTRKDLNGNATTFGTNVVYLYTSAASSTARFYDAVSGGNVITNVTISSGASTATFYYYDEVLGTKTVTASDNAGTPDGLAGIDDATDSIIVNAGATTQFLLNYPGTVVAGQRAAYVVTREDQVNNLVTSGLDHVYLYTTATSTGTFYNVASGGSPVTSVDITDGNASTTFWYTDTLAGTKTVVASDKSTYPPDGSTGIIDANDSISVIAAPVAEYIVAGPASAYAKTRAGFTVSRKDAFNNSVTSGTSTVYLYTGSASVNAKFYNDSLAGSVVISIDIPNGQSSVGFWYYDDNAGTYTITGSDATPAADGATGILDGTASINILPIAVKFVIIQPANGTVDSPITVTVQAQKPDNSVDINYQDDVTLNATGSATSTGAGLVSIVNGEGTKNISDTVAETVILSLTDSQGAGLDVTSSKSVTFGVGALAQYSLSHPGSAGAGTRAAYTVTRKDQYGNLATSGDSVVYLYSNSSSTNKVFYDAASAGNVIASTTIASGQSSASFWYYDDTLGSWTITASDGVSAPNGNTGIIDGVDSLTIVPGAVSQFLLNHSPAITADTRAAYTVTRKDTFGNLVTSGTNNVYLYSSSISTSTAFYLNASGGSPTTLTSINDGFSNTDFWYEEGVPGTYTITASDKSTAPPDGAMGIADGTDTLVVSAIPIVPTRIVITDPGTATVDAAVTVTVEAQDNSGSVDTTFSGSVILNTTGSASGGGPITITNGVGTKSISDIKAESVNLTLTDSGTGLNVSSGRTLTFNPGALTQFTVASPGDMSAGTRQTLTVSREDRFGNGVVSGLTTAYLYSSSANVNKRFYSASSGGSAITFFSFGAGVSSTQVWYYDEAAATTTVEISDNATAADGLAGIADGSTFVHVVPAAAAKFLLSNPGSMFVGTRAPYTVTRKDAFDNPVISGIGLAYLWSNSTGANKKFYDAATAGNIITSAAIDDGRSTANFWYYDDTAGSWTVTASNNSGGPTGIGGFTVATDNITVSLVPIVATRLVILPAGPSQIGNPALVTIQAEDSSGNIQTDYNNSVTLNVTGSATGGGVVNIANGIGVASVNDFADETTTLSLTDSNHTGLDTSSVQHLTFTLQAVLQPGFAGGGTPAQGLTPVIVGGVTLGGIAYPGAKISIVALGQTATLLKQSTVAAANGSFRIDFRGISTGARSYGLVVQDKNGQVSQSRTIDLNLINASDILEMTNILVSPTVVLARSTVTKGDRLIITGYSSPASTVRFEVDGKVIPDKAQAAADGTYRMLYRTGDLALGSHIIMATQQDSAGRYSDPSIQKVFNVSNLLVPQVDFNSDGKVNITDASIFLSRFNSTDPKVKILNDLNGDGKVDTTDFSIFLRTLRLQG